MRWIRRLWSTNLTTRSPTANGGWAIGAPAGLAGWVLVAAAGCGLLRDGGVAAGRLAPQPQAISEHTAVATTRRARSG